MDNNATSRLANLIQRASAERLSGLTCPRCRGGLDIQFVPKGRGGKGAGSTYVTCAQCMWRVISSGVPAEPPWVQALGRKVHTVGKSTSSASPKQTKKTKRTVPA